jgi:hypothetical protein
VVAALAVVAARPVEKGRPRVGSLWRAALRNGPLPKGADAWRKALGR